MAVAAVVAVEMVAVEEVLGRALELGSGEVRRKCDANGGRSNGFLASNSDNNSRCI